MASALGSMTTIATSTSLGNNGKGKKLGAMFDNYGRQLSSLSVFSPISFNRSSRRGTLRLRDREKVVNTRAMENDFYFNKDGSVTKKLQVREKIMFKGRSPARETSLRWIFPCPLIFNFNVLF